MGDVSSFGNATYSAQQAVGKAPQLYNRHERRVAKAHLRSRRRRTPARNTSQIGEG